MSEKTLQPLSETETKLFVLLTMLDILEDRGTLATNEQLLFRIRTALRLGVKLHEVFERRGLYFVFDEGLLQPSIHPERGEHILYITDRGMRFFREHHASTRLVRQRIQTMLREHPETT